MNKSFKIVILSLVGLVLIGVIMYFGLNKYYFGTFTSPGEDDTVSINMGKMMFSVKNGRYINDTYNFSLVPPSDWGDLTISQAEMPLDVGKGAIMVFRVEDETFHFSIGVSPMAIRKDDLFSNVGLKYFQDKEIQLGATILDSKLTKIDGEKALYIKSEYPASQGMGGTILTQYFVNNDDKYTLSIIASGFSENYVSLESKFNEVINSIKFTD